METPKLDPNFVMEYDVYGSDDAWVGKVLAIWVDDKSEALKFLGLGSHLYNEDLVAVPAVAAKINTNLRRIDLPYPSDQVAAGPKYDMRATFTPLMEEAIFAYYGLIESSRRSGGELSYLAQSDIRAESTSMMAGTSNVDPNAQPPAENPQGEWRPNAVENPIPRRTEEPESSFHTGDNESGVSTGSLEGSGG